MGGTRGTSLLDGGRKMVASYEGESGRNPYTRGLEHQNDLRNKNENSPLWKHVLIQHNGQQVSFKMDALRSFKHPMVRQVNEGARIKLTKADICMNSRSEFHQPSIVRVLAVRGNLNEFQTGAPFLLAGGRGMGGTRGTSLLDGGRGMGGTRGTSLLDGGQGMGETRGIRGLARGRGQSRDQQEPLVENRTRRQGT